MASCPQCLVPLELEVMETENFDAWRCVCPVCKRAGEYAYTPAQAEARYVLEKPYNGVDRYRHLLCGRWGLP